MAIDLKNFIEGIGTLTSKPVESPLFDEFIGEPQTQSKQYSNYTNTLPDETQYKTTSTPSYGYSLSDLERDPEFSAAAKRFLDGIGSNENIFEFLRDEKYNKNIDATILSFSNGNVIYGIENGVIANPNLKPVFPYIPQVVYFSSLDLLFPNDHLILLIYTHIVRFYLVAFLPPM